MKTMKKVVVAMTLAATGLSMTACTDEQVAVGAGIAVGAIIGSELGSSHHDHDRDRRHDHPGYGYGRPGYGGGYPGRGYGGYRGFSAETEIASAQVQKAAKNLATKYDLSDEAALTLAGPLVLAKNGDLSALSELGITQADVVAMAKDQNPPAQVLMTLSQKMDLSLADTHEVIQWMKADITQALSKK